MCTCYVNTNTPINQSNASTLNLVMPHKWANEIKAFVDGKTVQWRPIDNHVVRPWTTFVGGLSFFDSTYEFRIKPESVVKWVNVYLSQMAPALDSKEAANTAGLGRVGLLRLTFENNKVIAAEVES